MTREEAIEFGKRILCIAHPQKDASAYEFTQMAISALEKQNIYDDGENYVTISKALYDKLNVDVCDDAISREAVIEAVSEGCQEWRGIYGRCEELINALPSVTQNPGKWILLDECANSGYYCSNCQKKLVKEGWSDTVKKIKFCPNCGAKMVEPQESEVRNEVN